MPDREKVVEWADKCTSLAHESEDCNGCPYHLEHEGFYSCIECLLMDTVALLKEQQGTGCWEWITEDKYRCSECQNTTYVDECMEEPQYLFCPYCGHKMTFAGRSVKWK